VACFHPGAKPLLYVANQRSIRVYNLLKGGVVQKLESGVQWISSIALHPGGEHVVAGSYDHRTAWFDSELATTPYKTLRYHAGGVRAVAFHRTYPLLATASDDGTVHVFHARVFTDSFQNPVLVPVKVLRGAPHDLDGRKDGLGILDCTFHPTQPWVLTAGADGKVVLWHNMP
jgi:ribosome biogenesis protein ERB1